MRTRDRMLAIGIGLAWCSVALAMTSATEDTPTVEDRARVEAEAMGQAAEADRLFKAGDFAAALPLYEAERGSRAAIGDRVYEAYALRAAGCCRSRLGDDDAAIADWHAARKLDALRDDPGFVGYDWFLIGQAHFRRSRTSDAVSAFETALPRLSQAADRDHEADARLALAEALIRLDRPLDATRHLERAEALANVLNDPRRLATAYLASSLAARSSGAPGLAAEHADDARRAFDALGFKAESALSSRALGLALADLDHLDSATARLEDAVRAHESLSDRPALADDLSFLAAVRADAEDFKGAVRDARRVVSIRHDDDDASGEIDAIVALASYQDQGNDRAGSAETVASAVAIARREAAPAQLVRLLIVSAGLARRAGDPAKVDALLNEADRAARLADDASLKTLVEQARTSASKTGP